MDGVDNGFGVPEKKNILYEFINLVFCGLESFDADSVTFLSNSFIILSGSFAMKIRACQFGD